MGCVLCLCGICSPRGARAIGWAPPAPRSPGVRRAQGLWTCRGGMHWPPSHQGLPGETGACARRLSGLPHHEMPAAVPRVSHWREASSLTLTGCPCLDWTLLPPGGPAPTPSTLTPAPLLQVACEYGMVRVVSETGGPRGKDYCILYNPQWAHLPHDLSKAVSAGRARSRGLAGPAAVLLPLPSVRRELGGAEEGPQPGHWGCRRLGTPGGHGASLSLCHERRRCCHQRPGLGRDTAGMTATPPPGSCFLVRPGPHPEAGALGSSLPLLPLLSVPCGHRWVWRLGGGVPQGSAERRRPAPPACPPPSSFWVRVGLCTGDLGTEGPSVPPARTWSCPDFRAARVSAASLSLSCSCGTGRAPCSARRPTSPPQASATRSRWWRGGTAPSTRK